jgi:hypothetical protein
MTRHPLRNLIASIATVVAALAGVTDAPVDVPVVAQTRQVTFLTSDTRDMQGEVYTGLRGMLRPPTASDRAPIVIEQAPQLNWKNLDVLDGREMVWCLSGSSNTVFKQAIRDILNELSTDYPPSAGHGGVKWRESCPGAYTIGDAAEQDCRNAQAIGCASVNGLEFRGGKFSISAQAIRNGILRTEQGQRNVVIHEHMHIILTVDHTGCGAIPDAEPSNMSPFDVATQRACHTPPGDGIEEADVRLAVPKYNLKKAVPEPPLAPLTFVFLRRWVRPEWEPGCEVNRAGWCTSEQAPFFPSPLGMWLQIVTMKGLEEQSNYGFQWVGEEE